MSLDTKPISYRRSVKRQFERSVSPPFPRKNFLLEVTNRCNHACVFCSNKQSTRKPRDIDEAFAFRVLEEAYALGAREVGFYSCGEPLMCKDLSKYIAYAKKTGYAYTYITTNGALLTPQRLEEIADAGIDSIKFSLDSGERDTYRQLHGVDDFEKVRSNLLYAQAFREKQGAAYKLYISQVLTQHNIEKKEAFQDEYQRYCDEVVFVKAGNQGGLRPETVGQMGVEDSSAGEYNFNCYLPFSAINVTCEGLLSACCVDHNNNLIVADLSKVSLEEAWNSDAFRRLRQAFIDDSLQGTLCHRCLNNCADDYRPLEY